MGASERVVAPIRALLSGLDHYRGRRGRGPVVPSVGGLEVWPGEEGVYLSAELPEAAGWYVDVSVHDGRVLIHVMGRG